MPLGNVDKGTLITLTAQGAGSVSSGAHSNSHSRGVIVTIDVTAITGTGPSLTVTLSQIDPSSGKKIVILASAAISTVSTTQLKVYPGLTAAANAVVNGVLPPHFIIDAVVAGTAPSVTAKISAAQVL